MDHINVKRMGLAFGVTGSMLYAACMFVMAIAGKAQLVFLFNSLLHGIDISSIIKTDLPLLQGAMGLVETFILSWLIGACIASVYNFSTKAKK